MYHCHVKKNVNDARDFYNEGNYLMMDYPFKAMEFFNMSISFAPAHSVVLAQSYCARSEIYFHVEDYQRCMDNILLAEAIEVPKTWKQYHRNLRIRKRTCREKLYLRIPLIDENPFTFFRISQPLHPKNPAIAESLQIQNNNQYGRHIVTTKDLSPGEIIVVEDTPFKALGEAGAWSRCANCFRSNRMSLIPFKECACAMFCSKQCLEEGQDKYICAVDEEYNVIPRVLLTAYATFNNNLVALRKFMSNARQVNKTILDFNTSNVRDPSLKEKQLQALTSLKKYGGMEPLIPYIQNHPVLTRWYSPRDRADIADYMLLIASIFSNSLSFEWWQLRENPGSCQPDQTLSPKCQNIGVAIFLFSSLFSHSCCNNADRIHVDNKIVIYARLPIKAGEQITINYGTSFLKQNRITRRNWLQTFFNFECSCTACHEDWDRSLNIATFDPRFRGKTSCKRNKIESVRAAKFEFRENCKYIEKNHTKYPCYEIQEKLDRNYYLLTAIARCEPCLFLR